MPFAALVLPGNAFSDPPPTPTGWLRLLAVAAIVGAGNATLGPLVKGQGCGFYLSTVAVAALLLNTVLVGLAAAVTDRLHLPFQLVRTWTDAAATIAVLTTVSWLANTLSPARRGSARPAVGDDR